MTDLTPREQEAYDAGYRKGLTVGAPGWRGMDDAPRDGTVIDLWADDCRLANHFWSKANSAWATTRWQRGHSVTVVRIDLNPTHWQPLPFLPALVKR